RRPLSPTAAAVPCTSSTSVIPLLSCCKATDRRERPVIARTMVSLLVIVCGSAALWGDDPPSGNRKNQVQLATGVIQTAKAADFPGLSPSFLRPTAMTFVGPPSELMGPCPHTGISDYLLYVTGEDGIAWFLRDLKTGKLTFLGQEAAPCRGGRGILMALHSMLTVGTDGKGIV